MNEFDLIKLYLKYKISLVWAHETGYFKNVHFPDLPHMKCFIYKSQILSFEEWKDVYVNKGGLVDTYLGINLK